MFGTKTYAAFSNSISCGRESDWNSHIDVEKLKCETNSTPKSKNQWCENLEECRSYCGDEENLINADYGDEESDKEKVLSKANHDILAIAKLKSSFSGKKGWTNVNTQSIHPTFDANFVDDDDTDHEISAEDKPVAFTRVVSLGAFTSPVLYDINKSSGLLKSDRRKIAVQTPEFLSLRLSFAKEAIHSSILKASRQKKH
jgi:hypothetical protein